MLNLFIYLLFTMLRVKDTYIILFSPFVVNFATLPIDSWFAGAGVISANMSGALCHLVRQTRSDTPLQLISKAPIHWLVTACNRSLFSLY